MVGSIRLPSNAVVAMVEPEIAENTVPATIAMTESRPGTRRMSSVKASIALSATPVWNSTSPISTKNGIGVSEKLVIDCTALRASWERPGSPPRKTMAPTTLSSRNAKATGSPSPIAATRPPNSNRLPSIQLMQSAHRRGLDASRPGALEQAVEAKHEFDCKEHERHRQRRQQPPFREHEVLDGDGAEPPAVVGHREAVADEHVAHCKSKQIADRLHQPDDLRWNERQHDVDPHMLAATQQPRRRQQGHEIERVFGDFVRPREAAAQGVAQHDVGGDDDNHGQQDQRREHRERVAQPAEGGGEAGHGRLTFGSADTN